MRAFHCSFIERKWARAIPCDKSAVVIYEMKDGARAGFCEDHRAEGEKNAKFRGWTVVEPSEVAA